MKDNISPEEKLLRLIRGQKKPDTTVAKKIVTPISSAPGIKPTFKSSVYLLWQEYLSFINLGKIIRIAFILSCIYLGVSLIYPWVGLRKIKLPKVMSKKSLEVDLGAKVEIKPYEFYLEGIKEHQIFSTGPSLESGRPAGSVNVDLMKDINLVGIISGENPQAVIEDKKNQKTYYVSKGQFIGEYQVEDIQEGKIIINYRGQRFELFL